MKVSFRRPSRLRCFAAIAVTFVVLSWALLVAVAAARGSGSFPESLPLGSGLPVFIAPESENEDVPSGASVQEPRGVLDLQAALALALASNPELASYSWNVRAVEASVLQAGLRPNPELGVVVEDVLGSAPYGGFDEGQTSITLAQLVELGGKRQKRLRATALASDRAGWDYEIKRIEVFTATADAFIDVLAAQRRVGLAEQATALAEHVLATVTSRVSAGSSSEAERTKAQVALATAAIEADQTALELSRARRRLATQWGSPTAHFETAAGDLAAVVELPSLAELTERLALNPELARAATQLQVNDAELELERSMAVSDVRVGAGYRLHAFEDAGAFVAQLSVPLPLFDRNEGRILEAQRRGAQAQVLHRATEDRLASELQGAYEDLQTKQRQIERLRSQVLPAAVNAFESVNEGYREGRFSFLDVLDAERTLIAARAKHIDVLADFHQGLVQLERLTAQPIGDPQVETLGARR